MMIARSMSIGPVSEVLIPFLLEGSLLTIFAGAHYPHGRIVTLPELSFNCFHKTEKRVSVRLELNFDKMGVRPLS